MQVVVLKGAKRVSWTCRTLIIREKVHIGKEWGPIDLTTPRRYLTPGVSTTCKNILSKH
jgi:hypothetical protein